MKFEEEIEKCKKELELKMELKKIIVDENPIVIKRIFRKYNNDGSVYSRTTFIKYNTNKYYKKIE